MLVLLWAVCLCNCYSEAKADKKDTQNLFWYISEQSFQCTFKPQLRIVCMLSVLWQLDVVQVFLFQNLKKSKHMWHDNSGAPQIFVDEKVKYDMTVNFV